MQHGTDAGHYLHNVVLFPSLRPVQCCGEHRCTQSISETGTVAKLWDLLSTIGRTSHNSCRERRSVYGNQSDASGCLREYEADAAETMLLVRTKGDALSTRFVASLVTVLFFVDDFSIGVYMYLHQRQQHISNLRASGDTALRVPANQLLESTRRQITWQSSDTHHCHRSTPRTECRSPGELQNIHARPEVREQQPVVQRQEVFLYRHRPRPVHDEHAVREYSLRPQDQHRAVCTAADKTTCHGAALEYGSGWRHLFLTIDCARRFSLGQARVQGPAMPGCYVSAKHDPAWVPVNRSPGGTAMDSQLEHRLAGTAVLKEAHSPQQEYTPLLSSS